MCFYTIFPTKISDCKSTKFFNTKNINKINFSTTLSFRPKRNEMKRSGEILFNFKRDYFSLIYYYFCIFAH